MLWLKELNKIRQKLNGNRRKLTLVCTVHQALSPVQNPQSWQSYGPIETCYLASNLDEQLSESEYTQHLLPFVSCNSVLPALWLCHGTSIHASSSVKQNNTISIFIFLIIRYYMTWYVCIYCNEHTIKWFSYLICRLNSLILMQISIIYISSYICYLILPKYQE